MEIATVLNPTYSETIFRDIGAILLLGLNFM